MDRARSSNILDLSPYSVLHTTNYTNPITQSPKEFNVAKRLRNTWESTSRSKTTTTYSIMHTSPYMANSNSTFPGYHTLIHQISYWHRRDITYPTAETLSHRD